MTTPSRPSAAPAGPAVASRPGSQPPPRAMFNFGPMPPQKAKNFKQSARRLIAQLAPERAGLIGVLALAVSSVALSVLIPTLLGKATDVIYRGWFATPAGEAARRAAIAAADAAGHAG